MVALSSRAPSRLSLVSSAFYGITFTSSQRLLQKIPKGSLCFKCAQLWFCVPIFRFRALWRCAFKSSSNVPEQVSTFKAPAVCLAAWYDTALHIYQRSHLHCFFLQSRQRHHCGGNCRWLFALDSSKQLASIYSSNSSAQAVCSHAHEHLVHSLAHP